jgi:Holliday junction DNA helicase RuvA
MIAQLRGTLGDKRPNQVLVDVGGVGYLVHIPLSTFYALGDLHSNVREDAISLYGFLSAREKHLFELLISASGVGPVLALKILSGMSVDDLVPAVRSGDLARLTRIPGVGRKTAERMIVELRDKLAAMEIPEDSRKPVATTGTAGDVVSALLNLGYDQHGAEQAVERAGKNGASETFETLLRGALQQLTAPTQASARAAR